jgi:hypothetical protein
VYDNTPNKRSSRPGFKWFRPGSLQSFQVPTAAGFFFGRDISGVRGVDFQQGIPQYICLQSATARIFDRKLVDPRLMTLKVPTLQS